MSIQVKVFGQLTEIIGRSELQIEDAGDTKGIVEKLILDFPKLADCSFAIALNKKIINHNQKINSGDVVALMPPFAGG